MMRFLAAAFLAAVLAPVTVHAQSSCRLEQAHYALRGEPTVTARFRDILHYPGWLTNVALEIDFEKERDSFWWLFDQGSARFLNMISTTDLTKPGWVPPSETNRERGPLGETHVWFATHDYSLNYEIPRQGQSAPAHIFIPDLEELMWYGAEPRRGVPTAFFDLTSCR